jgi:acetylornithine deacetylase
MSFDANILEYVDSHRDDVIDLERRLIQTRSVTGDESEIAGLVAEECRKDGLTVEFLEPAPKRVSVVAKYKGSVGKPRVMWYSHYDTLPSGDEKQWRCPPYGAVIEEDWIYGRGTADNKTATCASIMAFRAIRSLGIRLKGDLLFTHVADEEAGGTFGFRNILDKGYGEGVDCLF